MVVGMQQVSCRLLTGVCFRNIQIMYKFIALLYTQCREAVILDTKEWEEVRLTKHTSEPVVFIFIFIYFTQSENTLELGAQEALPINMLPRSKDGMIQ